MNRLLAIILAVVMSLACSAQEGNPFDIQRTDTVPQVLEDTRVDSLPEEQTKLDDENPFSVSHIPIRKNQYEQIEQLTINKHRAEESISITHLPLWLIIFSLALLAFIIVKSKGHLYMLARTLFNDNLLRQKAFEEHGGLSLIYLSGYMLFLINISLFIYLIFNKTGTDEGMGYFALLGLVSLFFVGKHLVLYVFSNIYEFEKEAMVYSFTINTIYNFLSVLFVSLNVIMLFGPDSWTRIIGVIGIVLFIIFLLSRYYKGLLTARKFLSGYFFHFFLYFCAFEFSPWLVIYTLLRDIN